MEYCPNGQLGDILKSDRVIGKLSMFIAFRTNGVQYNKAKDKGRS